MIHSWWSVYSKCPKSNSFVNISPTCTAIDNFTEWGGSLLEHAFGHWPEVWFSLSPYQLDSLFDPIIIVLLVLVVNGYFHCKLVYMVGNFNEWTLKFGTVTSCRLYDCIDKADTVNSGCLLLLASNFRNCPCNPSFPANYAKSASNAYTWQKAPTTGKASGSWRSTDCALDSSPLWNRNWNMVDSTKGLLCSARHGRWCSFWKWKVVCDCSNGTYVWHDNGINNHSYFTA